MTSCTIAGVTSTRVACGPSGTASHAAASSSMRMGRRMRSLSPRVCTLSISRNSLAPAAPAGSPHEPQQAPPPPALRRAGAGRATDQALGACQLQHRVHRRNVVPHAPRPAGGGERVGLGDGAVEVDDEQGEVADRARRGAALVEQQTPHGRFRRRLEHRVAVLRELRVQLPGGGSSGGRRVSCTLPSERARKHRLCRFEYNCPRKAGKGAAVMGGLGAHAINLCASSVPSTRGPLGHRSLVTGRTSSHSSTGFGGGGGCSCSHIVLGSKFSSKIVGFLARVLSRSHPRQERRKNGTDTPQSRFVCR